MSVFVQGPSASGVHPMDGPNEKAGISTPMCATPLSEVSTAPNTPILRCGQQFQLTEQIGTNRESVNSILETDSDFDDDDQDADIESDAEDEAKGLMTLETLEKSMEEVEHLLAEKYGCFDTDLSEEQECEHDEDGPVFETVGPLPPSLCVSSVKGLLPKPDMSPVSTQDDDILWMQALDGSLDCQEEVESLQESSYDDTMLWMQALGGSLEFEEPADYLQDSACADGSDLWMCALDGSTDLYVDQSDAFASTNEQCIAKDDPGGWYEPVQQSVEETPQAEYAIDRDPQQQELAELDITPSPRFRADDLAWLEHLDSQGFVVIANAADAVELSRAEDLLWQFLEGCTDWRRHEPDTWQDEGLADIGTCKHGIIDSGGIGQSDFMWFLRTLPLVRQVFADIWATNDLISSFDGSCVFRPWHHGFRKTACGWWHVDQGASKKGRHAVQGILSLFEANGRTGGLTVVPGSHLLFDEFIRGQRDPCKDFYPIPHNSVMLKEHSKRLVCCLPGDLILWDSRTIHASAPAPLQPETPADQLLRAIGYICMTPKSFASEDVLAKRRFAYEHQLTSSHWPHQLDLKKEPTEDDEPLKSLSEAPLEIIALVG